MTDVLVCVYRGECSQGGTKTTPNGYDDYFWAMRGGIIVITSTSIQTRISALCNRGLRTLAQTKFASTESAQQKASPEIVPCSAVQCISMPCSDVQLRTIAYGDVYLCIIAYNYV